MWTLSIKITCPKQKLFKGKPMRNYDVTEATKTILEGMNTSNKVYLVFADSSDRVAKGTLVLEALVASRTVPLTVKYPSLAGVKYITWVDGKSVEIITHTMLEKNVNYTLETLPGLVYDLSGKAANVELMPEPKDLVSETNKRILAKKVEKENKR